MLKLSLAPFAGAAPHWPGVPDWMAGLLSARGVQSAQEAQAFLHPDFSQIRPPFALPGMERAAAILRRAVEDGKKIAVYGDYDVDGVCAAAILQGTLEKLGADGIIFPERDTAEKLAFMLQKDNVTEYIDFHGYKIVEIRVPNTWIGKSLVDLEIRSKYDVSVLATIDSEGKADIPPSPRKKFKEDDIVSILGTDKTIAKLTRYIR